jgi:hypothetical protein
MPKMKLWYQILQQQEGYENLDVVAEFLEVWINTRRPQAIDPGELAGVIDVLYDCAPAGTEWVTILARPQELADYITVYMKDDNDGGAMMKGRDNKLSAKYKEWLQRGHQPPPILLAGAENDEGTERGIMLIDGRHRIHAAIAAGLQTIKAYIPKDHLSYMDAAELAS